MNLSFMKALLLFLASSFLFTQIHAQETTRGEKIQEWIELLASDKKEQVDGALEALSKNQQEAFPALLKALGNANKLIRSRCLQVLSSSVNQEVVSALIERAGEEDDVYVLRQMLAIFGKEKARQAIPRVVSLLEHSDEHLQADAIWTLVSLQDEQLPSRLLEMLKKGRTPIVKAAIFNVMAASQDKEKIMAALETLPKQTQEEEKEEVLMAACNCASALNDSFGQEVLADMAGGSSQKTVRRYALLKLLPMIGKQNAGLLIETLWDDDEMVRGMAFHKLLETVVESFDYDPQAKPLDRAAAIEVWEKWWRLQKALDGLDQADGKKREELAKEIEGLGEITAPYLFSYYRQTSESNKPYILKTLSRWDTPQVVSFLTDCLKDGEKIEEVALEGLMNIQSRRKNPVIEQTLSKRFVSAREEKKMQMAGPMAAYGDKEAVDFVNALLKDPARFQEALSLVENYRLNHPEIVSALAVYLKEENKERKEKAIQTMFTLKFWESLVEQFTQLSSQQKLDLVSKIEKEYKSNLPRLIPLLNTETEENVRIKLVEAVAALSAGQAELTRMLSLDLGLPLYSALLKALEGQKAIKAASLVAAFMAQKKSELQLVLVQSLPIGEEKEIQSLLESVILGEFDHPVRTEALKKGLLTQNASKIVEVALEKFPSDAAHRVSWLSSIKTSLQKTHFEKFSALFKKEDRAEVKKAFVETSGQFGYDENFPLLKELLEKETNIALKEAAFLVLSSYRQKETIEFLEKLGETQDPISKALAHKAIFEIDSEKGTELLLKDLNEAKANFKALEILISKSPKIAKKQIAAFFTKTKTDEEMLHALKLCAPVFGPEQIGILMDLLSSPEVKVRVEIGKMLDFITGIQSGYDPNDLNPQKAIELWKQWQKRYDEIKNLVASLARKEEEEKTTEKLVSYGEEAVDALLKALAEEKEPAVKIAMLQALSRTKSQKKSITLKSYLRDAHEEVRSKVYEWMAEDESFIAEIPFLYLSETDSAARLVLLSLMNPRQFQMYREDLTQYSKASTSRTLANIQAILAKQDIPDRNRIVADLLQGITQEEAILGLLETFKGKKRVADLSLLIGLLKKQPASKIQDAILGLLKPYRQVPEAAKDAKAVLAWWNERHQEMETLISLENKVDRYVYGSAYESLSVRKELERIADIQKTFVIEELSKKYQTPTISEVQKTNILDLLAFYASPNSSSLFIDSLNDGNKEIRQIAAQGAYRTNYGGDAKSIQKAYEHGDPTVRFFAIKAMGESKDLAFLPSILKAFGDEDVRVREESLFWAMKLGFKDREAVAKLLQDKGPWIKTLAIKMARELKLLSQLDTLVACLNDPFPWVREAAYQALTELTGQKIVYQPLETPEKRVDGLQKWQSWLRRHQLAEETDGLLARFAEEEINREKVRATLVEKYKGADPESAQTMLDKIIQAMKDERGIVRTEAITLLAELGQRNSSKEIANGLSDPDIRVREASLEALKKLSKQTIDMQPPRYDEWSKETEKIKAWWSERLPKRIAQEEENNLALSKKVAETLEGIASGKQDHKSLIALGEEALVYVRPYLKDARSAVAISAAQTLCHFKSYMDVADMLSLLVDKASHSAVRKALEEMIGQSLPLDTEKNLAQRTLLTRANEWYQKTSAENHERGVESIEGALNELIAKPEQLKEIARKLSDLGPAMRNDLQEYLADKRPMVTHGIVLALAYLNDTRSIPALLAAMKESASPAKESILIGIHTLAGKNLYEGTPKTDKDWEEAALAIERWWKDFEGTRKSELSRLIEEHKSLLQDPANREKTTSLISAKGPEICDAVLVLLKDPTPALRTAALMIFGQVRDARFGSSIVPLLADPDENVRKLAQETIGRIAGKALPESDLSLVMTDGNRAELKQWWEGKKDSFNLFNERDFIQTLTAIGHEKMDREQALKTLKGFKTDLVPMLLKRVRSSDDALRVGSFKALSLLCSFAQVEVLHGGLSDTNVKVRKAAYEGLASKMEENLPVAFPIQAEETWTENVKKWLPEWSQKEEKLLLDAQLQQFEKDAAAAKAITRLWASKQVGVVRTLLSHLGSQFVEVRTKAYQALRPILEAEDKKIEFKSEAPWEERQPAIDEMKEWLDAAEKQVKQQEKDLDQKVAEIADKEGDLLTVDGCKKLQNLIDEMRQEENAHPALQQKYAEFLKKKGCELFSYDVYGHATDRDKVLYQIEEWVYDYKNKLTDAESSAALKEQDLQKAFSLEAIQTSEDLALCQGLVGVLSHLHYPLRKRASEVLFRLAGENRGYSAEASLEECEKAVASWKEWLKEAEKKLQEKKQAYAKSLRENVELALKNPQIDDLKMVTLFVEALGDGQSDVRESAIQGLKALCGGETFGYNAALAPEGQKEAFEKWGKWMADQRKKFAEREKIKKIADEVASSDKVKTSAEVANLKILVHSLGVEDVWVRKSAFQALSTYASKNASHEVREDFGYDPIAPENIRQKTQEDWNKWIIEKVEPISRQEEEKLSAVRTIVQQLPSELTSVEDCQQASRLVEMLSDAIPTVRMEVFAALCKLSQDEKYGFVPHRSPAEQSQELELWKWWIKLEKRKVEKQIADKLRQMEQSIRGISGKKGTPEYFELLDRVVSAMEERESKIREYGFSWLQEQTGQKFDFSPTASWEERKRTLPQLQRWSIVQKNMAAIEGYDKEIGEEALDKSHVASLEKLLRLVDHAFPEISDKALGVFARLNKETKVRELAQKKDELKKTLELWIRGEEKKIELKNATVSLKQISNQSDLKAARSLIDSLESEYGSVREYAIVRLNALSGKTFVYKANDPHAKRLESIDEVERWYDEKKKEFEPK